MAQDYAYNELFDRDGDASGQDVAVRNHCLFLGVSVEAEDSLEGRA